MSPSGHYWAMTTESDDELWRRAATEPDAFGQLFERHARAVYAYCAWRCGDWTMGEDLTSVVFLEAWTHRQTAISGESLRPWLLGIANNVCRNAVRSLRRHRGALSRLPRAGQSPSFEETSVDHLDATDRVRVAQASLSSMSEVDQEIITLVLWCGLCYEEAATALNIPVGTVRSRVSRARSRLQRSLSIVPAEKGSAVEY